MFKGVLLLCSVDGQYLFVNRTSDFDPGPHEANTAITIRPLTRNLSRFLPSESALANEVLSVFTLMETICLKMWAKPLLKNANSTPLIDLRRSKPPLLFLKLPTD